MSNEEMQKAMEFIVDQQPHSISRDIGTLSVTTRATDGRLNALINVVERQISESRNGKP